MSAQSVDAGDGPRRASRELAVEERQRAEFYEFLATMLARPPSARTLEVVAALEPDDTVIGRAVDALRKIAARTSESAASDEFHALFIGLGRGELMPYASYYMTGFLNEKPLAGLREDMARLMVKRAPNVFEPEDNVATLCEIMAGLIRGRFGSVVSLAEQRNFFNAHLGPWAEHFFSDLERAKTAVLYAPLGTMGRAFVEIERDAFRMEGATA